MPRCVMLMFSPNFSLLPHSITINWWVWDFWEWLHLAMVRHVTEQFCESFFFFSLRLRITTDKTMRRRRRRCSHIICGVFDHFGQNNRRELRQVKFNEWNENNYDVVRGNNFTFCRLFSSLLIESFAFTCCYGMPNAYECVWTSFISRTCTHTHTGQEDHSREHQLEASLCAVIVRCLLHLFTVIQSFAYYYAAAAVATAAADERKKFNSGREAVAEN